jgi:hypothetical protein
MAIIHRKKEVGRREINLNGPEGNAFALLGYAKDFSDQLNHDWAILLEELTSGDYDHLLKTFDKYFGSFCDLVYEED